MSYSQKYFEKTRGSPESTKVLGKLKMDPCLASQVELPASLHAEQNSITAFEAGDDAVSNTKPDETILSPEKSPSRSRIPLPQCKRSTPQIHREYDQSSKLEARFQLKTAEVTRLEQELKTTRTSLEDKVKEAANAKRDLETSKKDYLRLKVDVQRIKVEQLDTKKALSDVNKAKECVSAKHNALVAHNANKGWSHTTLFFVLENLGLLAVFMYFAYLEYQADILRQEEAKSTSWFGMF